ncbi:hypothetical protein cyc_00579 [Cyclospora cayetanensis]|uniref:Uncharacterized protein n=1 Tax=Cyclospora cayetanensis TaxID=88456 RepID=A0A1D3CYQ3_9EIME|nr:hypothetical protein cyc_00579 [Cyclospora cayetanensis]
MEPNSSRSWREASQELSIGFAANKPCFQGISHELYVLRGLRVLWMQLLSLVAVLASDLRLRLVVEALEEQVYSAF